MQIQAPRGRRHASQSEIRSEAANRLLRADDPYIVMQMPKCILKVVNRKHAEVLGGDEYVALNESEYQEKVSRLPAPSAVTCYCETPLRAIIALDPADCVFDYLGTDGGSDFELMHIESQSDRRRRGSSSPRRYRVARVFVRKLPFRPTGRLLHLEARLVCLPSMELRVSTSRDKETMTTRLGIPDGGKFAWSTQIHSAAKTKRNRYRKIQAVFEEAHDQLLKDQSIKSTEQLLWDAVDGFRHGTTETAAYVGFRALVKSVFDDPERPIQEVANQLASIRDRMLDAPVVGREVRRVLARRFADKDWVRHVCSHIPLPVGDSFVRASMNGDDLDALDSALGAAEIDERFSITAASRDSEPGWLGLRGETA